MIQGLNSSTMALAMDVQTLHNFDPFHDYSTTTTITTPITSEGGPDHGYANWNAWSPVVVDWDAFPDLILMDSCMLDNDNDDPSLYPPRHVVVDEAGSNSSCSSDDSSTDNLNMVVDDDDEENKTDDIKGLRLVHLLIAAAEAFTGDNKNRDLVRVILVRLKELVSPTHGSNIERLSAYFTDALQILLDCNGGSHGRTHSITNGRYGPHRDDHQNPTDVLAAFQILQDMSPYVKFGHFTANQAILEAVGNERRVHIVDYDIMEGIQWASLMQSLVSKKDGSPAPHLRITAISRGGAGKKSFWTLQDTGRRLTAFAASIGQPFSFHQCRLDSDESFKPSAVRLVNGEVLVINCMLHLPHFTYRAPESFASFLSGSKSLNPRVGTLVEEEVGPAGESGFMGRFMDTLHHYSAVCDSLEAGFPMQNRSRALVERVFLGARIAGSLARIYKASGGIGGGGAEEGAWGERLGAGGFRGVPISSANHCQAKLLLGLFNDGYRVDEAGGNKMVLGWKSRALLSASVWQYTADSD